MLKHNKSCDCGRDWDITPVPETFICVRKQLLKNTTVYSPALTIGLLKLPGIGKYTAAAIASFAFGEKVPVVDGNVIRVLSRIYGIEEDVTTTRAQQSISDLAKLLIPDDQPDLFNQAIMEFGAIQCVPKNPACEKCIFNGSCYAHLHHKVHAIPLKIKKSPKRIRYFNYLVIEHGGNFILKVRSGNDIWHGLYEFPLIESEQLIAPEQLELHLPEWLKSAILVDESRLFKHILTHQEIMTVFYTFRLNGAIVPNTDSQFRFYDKKEIEQLPKPILIERFLKEKII